MRLAMGVKDGCRPSDWNCKTLGAEFRARVAKFEPRQINLFPYSMRLLHAGNGGKLITISRES
jgi:hypothetical protein